MVAHLLHPAGSLLLHPKTNTIIEFQFTLLQMLLKIISTDSTVHHEIMVYSFSLDS